MNVTSPPLSNAAPAAPPGAINTPAGQRPAPHVRCFACGEYRRITEVQPVDAVDGHVLSWVCDDCRQEVALKPAPMLDVSPSSRYTVGLMTILKAARLAHRGYGRSADDVMNRALDQYEATSSERT